MRNQKNDSTQDQNNEKGKRNIYLEITNKIIAKMKVGKLLWKQGFRQIPAQNWSSKTTYSGINAVILNFLYGDEPCPFYCTMKQIRSMGGSVKKGSKGKMIVFYAPLYKQDGKYIQASQFKTLTKTQQKDVNSFHALKSYYVFNMLDTQDCKGFEYEKWQNMDATPENLEDIEVMNNYNEMLSHYTDKPASKADRNKNAYSPTLDLILYVPLKRWDNCRDFVSTMCHEIIHSTGHEKRLNRPNLIKPHAFGTPEYAQEELLAELGAAFLCQYIGILPTQVDNAAAYLQAWIKALENDERLIFKAAAQAQKAVDYILNDQLEQNKIYKGQPKAT